MLKLFDFFAVLLVGTSVFLGFVPWLSLPGLSWRCCWCLCHGAMAVQAFAWAMRELFKHLLPFPPPLVTGELRLRSYGQIQIIEQCLCSEFMFPAVCRQELPHAL